MRTVRETLRESNPQEIADIILQLHLDTLFEQSKPEDTVADTRRLVVEWTNRVISNILNAPPQKEDSPFVFFAVPAVPEGPRWFSYGTIAAAMCEQSEFLQDEPEPDSYSWLGQTNAAIADSLFADTLLTAENRSEVLAHILWDLTWFGETDEKRRHYFDSLENDADEPDSEENEDDDFDWEAELEHFRAERDARRDEKEEELKRDANQAEHAYYEYCFQREVRLVKALLEEHMASKNGIGS